MTDLPSSSSRRRFLQAGAAALGGLAAPALVAAESARPVAAQGLQFGDPLDARPSSGAAATAPRA